MASVFLCVEEVQRTVKRLISIFFGVILVLPAMAQNVILDDDVGIDREELERVVASWTSQMQQAAANDLGDRMELLNLSLANKKIARAAQQMSPEADPDVYWEYMFKLRNFQRRFMAEQFLDKLEIPDMSALAAERYETEKDTYALVPEHRISSHILFKCLPGECNRNELRPQAQAVLDELLQGADFAEMVESHSQDPGSKDSGGVFNKWMKAGEPGVTPPYVWALFQIDEEGHYSELVETQFGFHIIRLDGVKEHYYQPYEKVKLQIIDTLRTDYKKLAVKEYDAQFRMSDDVYIDGEAMDEIFLKYKTPE
ncbi:MAG: hypothetical protein DRR04_02535 [Gammaproteobacteria bacterium]|nr:MAG: hypothetical protein DRR04_02535 [Gammaproteobacteria bacterium]